MSNAKTDVPEIGNKSKPLVRMCKDFLFHFHIKMTAVGLYFKTVIGLFLNNVIYSL